MREVAQPESATASDWRQAWSDTATQSWYVSNLFRKASCINPIFSLNSRTEEDVRWANNLSFRTRGQTTSQVFTTECVRSRDTSTLSLACAIVDLYSCTREKTGHMAASATCARARGSALSLALHAASRRAPPSRRDFAARLKNLGRLLKCSDDSITQIRSKAARGNCICSASAVTKSVKLSRPSRLART